MIPLFHIPDYTIDTSKFNHFLHASIVEEFESNFRKYVGAKYSCTVNSATNAIFLAFLNKNTTVNIPSLIPPVVGNALLTSGNQINFTDDVKWVGDSYILHDFGNYKIIDSAQKVDHHQFIKEANDQDLMMFSFYPTKPIGGSDGGIIVSNDAEKIEFFKEATMNGMTYSHNNWDRTIKFPGYKMYMNSIQCYIANKNLSKLDDKKKKLAQIRNLYNSELGYNNTSDHLYRINTSNNKEFIAKLKEKNIIGGIHYDALHLNKVYCPTPPLLPHSESEAQTRVSIPFNEKLDLEKEVPYIIDTIKDIL